MTSAEDLRAALFRSPRDRELRLIYADRLEDDGQYGLASVHRGLVAVLQAKTREEAIPLYEACFPRGFAIFNGPQIEMVARCLTHLGLADYLLARGKESYLNGSEMSGRWLRGYAWVLEGNIDTVHELIWMGRLAGRPYWGENARHIYLDQLFLDNQPGIRLPHVRKAPYLLYQDINIGGNPEGYLSTWVIEEDQVYPETPRPGLFLLQGPGHD